MNKNLSYESPDIFMEQFVCEEGVFASTNYTISDAENGDFDDATPTSYEAFFYGNIYD